MLLSQLSELQYITRIENVPSILKLGILCHNRAEEVPHERIDDPSVQLRRAPKLVAQGRTIHDYANLFITARNSMMFRLRDIHEKLCVLRVALDVLDLPDTIVSDLNAASDRAEFRASPQGLAAIDYDAVFARYWVHLEYDEAANQKHKLIKSAEVLVSDHVHPRYVKGAYVSGSLRYSPLKGLLLGLTVQIDADLFFQSRGKQ